MVIDPADPSQVAEPPVNVVVPAPDSVPPLKVKVLGFRLIVPLLVRVPPAIVSGSALAYVDRFDAVPLFSVIEAAELVIAPLRVRFPPLTVTKLPPEPSRLDASSWSELVAGAPGILTVAVVQNRLRITPWETATS